MGQLNDQTVNKTLAVVISGLIFLYSRGDHHFCRDEFCRLFRIRLQTFFDKIQNIVADSAGRMP